MLIDLIPQRRDGTLALHRDGDVLTVNGTAFDFSPLPEGGTLPGTAVACDWLAGDVTRTDGRLHLALILPHGPDADAAALFPDPVEALSGPVDLPGHPGAQARGTGGTIDWDQLVTAEAGAAAALADWRANARLSRAEFMAALIGAGVATRAEVFAMRQGIPPAALAPVFDALPESLAESAILLMAEAQTFERLDPILTALGGALGWSEAQQDALFGWVA